MANIPLQSITFPGLSDKYTTPTVDATLTQTGAAADAKKTGDELAGLKNDLNQKADKTDALSAYVVETATGSIASFTDGADNVPVKDLTVAIEPVQSGSGDPSPENVRPISGWTGANVTVNDDVFSIDFPTEAGTVYGGTLDVTTGVLTVDRAYALLNDPDKWVEPPSGSTVTYKYTDTFDNRKLYSTSLEGLTCSMMPVNSGTIRYTARWLGANDVQLGLAFNATTPEVSLAEIKTLASNGDISIVYDIATPQTYQLTPQEVNTILGQNNIFADTGNSTVQYRADTKLYIDKVLST